jgi:hypothetical protein
MAAITHPKSLKRPFSSSTNAATVSSAAAASVAMQLLEASFDVNLTFRLFGTHAGLQSPIAPAITAHHRGPSGAHSFW